MIVTVGLVGAATTGSAAAQRDVPSPASPPQEVHTLVSSDGRLVPQAEVLPSGSGQGSDPGGLVEDLELGAAPTGAVPTGARESVIGADGRTQVSTPSAWPSSAIGEISFTAHLFGFTCTGVLIDRNTVLTAGSCLKHGGSGAQDGWYENVRFTPGLGPVEAGAVSVPYGTCRATQTLTTAAWANSADENHNWGLIQLNCSAGNAAGWMSYRAESVDGNLLDQPVTVRGYPSGTGRPLFSMWTMDDRIRAVTADLVFTQADLSEGQQGAPIYQASGCNGPCVLGVAGQFAHGSTPPHSTDNHGIRITAARANEIAAGAAANNGPVASNDDFAGATLLSGQEGTVSFDTTGSSRQRDEPHHATHAGVASVWFRWTAPTTGFVTFDTADSSFDALVGAYTGSSLTNLTERGSNHFLFDYWSTAAGFQVVEGTTYRIAVDGQKADTGAGTLSWHMDVEDPTITVTTPPPGATYTQGQVVNADYACEDSGGSQLSSCTGTVADGSPINTAATGTRIFSVTATDNAGNQHQVTRTYTVTTADTAGPAITVTTPTAGAVFEQGRVVMADYACSDPSGVASCVGTVADGARLSTAQVGNRTFRVDATDTFGNASFVVRTYRVVRHRPDGHVRRDDERAFIGDGVLNTTGQGQARSALVARGRSSTFHVRVQNDGSVADAFTVLGSGTSNAFTARWFAGRTEVTGRVRAGTYRTAALAPGATVALRVVLTARATSVRGQALAVSTRLASAAVPGKVDVVRTTVTRA
jgi:V8-like Glu-specific endopeptidase